MDVQRAKGWIDQVWDDTITPTLVEYIRIPNKSPSFDANWAENGYMDDAIDLALGWVKAHSPSDATIEVVRLPGRTPVLMIEVPGDTPGNVLLYGHLDKQPEMTGWADDLGPWIPVIKGEKLYGRGGADDGYAVFASLTAINALREQGIPHPRCVVLIECCEESGSYDLPPYIDHLSERIGSPDLVVCLDSGAGNYEQLWCTTSLRGLIGGRLSVDVLTEGVHSGDASGVVASSFRVARMLMERIEDTATGAIKLESLNVDIPRQREAQARAAAAILGTVVSERFPYVEGMGPVEEDRTQLVLNRTWRPALSTTGAGGLPDLGNAGNVLRPGTALQLSIRTPPTVDAETVYHELKAELERDPPYGAKVSFGGHGASGWHAPMLRPWLHEALNAASQSWFDKPAMYMGEGGTIPFMGMLGDKFPEAQFVITGVLGPGSNAHGPNEFLHLTMGKRLTGCVAQVLQIHGQRGR
jgi:acetylornithine deacetylase/succinyl-diaminopimelate desuccinylase-like protein